MYRYTVPYKYGGYSKTKNVLPGLVAFKWCVRGRCTRGVLGSLAQFKPGADRHDVQITASASRSIRPYAVARRSIQSSPTQHGGN